MIQITIETLCYEAFLAKCPYTLWTTDRYSVLMFLQRVVKHNLVSRNGTRQMIIYFCWKRIQKKQRSVVKYSLFVKTFYSVSRNKSLSRFKTHCPRSKNVKVCARNNGILYDNFESNIGVKQGCILCPFAYHSLSINKLNKVSTTVLTASNVPRKQNVTSSFLCRWHGNIFKHNM